MTTITTAPTNAASNTRGFTPPPIRGGSIRHRVQDQDAYANCGKYQAKQPVFCQFAEHGRLLYWCEGSYFKTVMAIGLWKTEAIPSDKTDSSIG